MRFLLEKAVQLNTLRSIDLHAGLFVEQIAGGSCPELLLAASLTSRSVGEGHICLPLDEVAGQPVFTVESSCIAPELGRWRECLFASGIVGEPGGAEPLILEQNRLYLAKYHRCETRIAEDLIRRNRNSMHFDLEKAIRLLALLFPDKGKVDWQKLAAAAALIKQFLVISGGPGTGKTFTVARILALLQSLAGGQLRIGLAAPTGRAAVRLHESIIKAKESMVEELAAVVPDQTLTLHRLLGLMPYSGRFHHNMENPLHLDLLVIDEASMIDVPLMASLVEALPEKARFIMLGDRDQLTSVEAGSLFGDICGSREPQWSSEVYHNIRSLTGIDMGQGQPGGTFGDSVVQLRTSYRFAEKSAIGEIARMVNSGKRIQLAELLGLEHEGFVYEQPEQEEFLKLVAERLWSGFGSCFAAQGPEEALSALSRFRVLCALREGKAGVAGLNQLAESILHSNGLITGNDRLYRGRPIMIRTNHYGLQLFNGDTGIIWPDREGKLWAWFSRPDGSLFPIIPSRLPDHETAYATTVHKAQGSEFDEVVFVLPFEDNRVLTRELIYTGITRARKKLTLCGDFSILAKSIERSVVRYSGLTDKLWQDK
ncbi:MAG: exodeoxyribonuclease V subunit alpha [Desulfobulbales bacterium]